MRRALVGLSAILGTTGLLASLASAPAAAQAPVPARGAAAATSDYTFTTGAGALYFYVKPDRVADFDALVAQLGQTLEQSADPVRKQQSASWRIYKSAETPRDAAIYVCLFDPAVPAADYDPVKVLGEAMPAEAQALFERMRADILRVERMALQRVR